MKKSTQLPNENLLNDAMSTTSLEAFYDDVEQQLVSRMQHSAPVPPTRGPGTSWGGLAGGAIAVLLVGAAVVYYATRPEPLTVSSAPTRTAPEPAAVTTTTTPQVATRPEPRTVQSPAPSQIDAPRQQSIGATSVAKVTAQAQPTTTLSSRSKHDIDSLSQALRTAATPSDAARIEYQLGVRYRIAGDNSTALGHLMRSSASAEKVGAHVLAARGRQQAAKAALQLGEHARAVSLYGQALTILPNTEAQLRAQWQHELDSIQR